MVSNERAGERVITRLAAGAYYYTTLCSCCFPKREGVGDWAMRVAHRWVDVKFYRNQATGFLGIEVDKYLGLLIGVHDGIVALVIPFLLAVLLLAAAGWCLVNCTDLLHYEQERAIQLSPLRRLL